MVRLPSLQSIRLFLLALAVLVGCKASAPTSPPPMPEPPQFFVHIVQKSGESYRTIAKSYTGSEKNWQAVGKANSAIGGRKLAKGDYVNIPLALMKRGAPQPDKKTAPARSTPKPRTTPESLAGRSDFLVDDTPEALPTIEVESSPFPDTAIQPSAVEPTVAPDAPTVPEAAVATPVAPVEPVAAASEPKAVPAADKSMDQLLAEERAAVEQLQKELDLGPEAVPAN